MFVGVFQQVVRRVTRRSVLDATPWTVAQARYYWRQFHIDDAGHNDWEGAIAERKPRTIQIRFSCVPESMIDALHGLRAIERRFGRIRDYRLLRDSEIRSEYQAICWAAFESPRSLLRVPPRGTTLKVVLPPSLCRPEGGPGWGDVRSLLVPEICSESTPSSSPDESIKSDRFITLTIKRAGAEIIFRSIVKPPYRSRAMKAAIGHAFLEWGGFSLLKPLYESSPFTLPAQDLPTLDSKNMRVALNKWSQILGVPDPLFPEMQHHATKAETRGQRDLGSDWEPLSELPRISEIEADGPVGELKTSQSTQDSLKQSFESLLQRSEAYATTGTTGDVAEDCPIRGEKT